MDSLQDLEWGGDPWSDGEEEADEAVTASLRSQDSARRSRRQGNAGSGTARQVEMTPVLERGGSSMKNPGSTSSLSSSASSLGELGSEKVKMNLNVVSSGQRGEHRKSSRRKKKRQRERRGVALPEALPQGGGSGNASPAAAASEEVDIFGMFGMDVEPEFGGQVLSPEKCGPAAGTSPTSSLANSGRGPTPASAVASASATEGILLTGLDSTPQTSGSGINERTQTLDDEMDGWEDADFDNLFQ